MTTKLKLEYKTTGLAYTNPRPERLRNPNKPNNDVIDAEFIDAILNSICQDCTNGAQYTRRGLCAGGQDCAIEAIAQLITALA